MRRPSLVLLSGLIGSLVLSSTATTAVASTAGNTQAGPVPTGQAALTGNPIYKTGKFDFKECKELALHPGSAEVQLYAKEPRLYMDHMLGCLNEAWATEFKQARLRFAKPKVQYVTGHKQRTRCGTRLPRFAIGMYCPHKRTMVVLLNRSVLADPTSLLPITLIAHEYGHHVQEMSGVFKAVNRQARRLSVRRRLEYVRRMELQAECYAGAFLGAIWHSLERDEFEVEDLMDQYLSTHTHGKAKSNRVWLNRGYQGESPASCNTWAASRAAVA